MGFPSSLLLATLLAALCNSLDPSTWTKIDLADFPTDPIIGSTFAHNDMMCSAKAVKNTLCNLFCHDVASMSCEMYRLPVIKPPYICFGDITCGQGTLSCYQKALPSDVFIGADVGPFSGAELDNGKVKARKIYNIPMNRRWQWPLPPGKVLKLTIHFFNLGPCCSCAYLEVLNLQSGALINGPYCGALAVPFTITIPTRNVELHFFSDGSQILDGFEFSYESIEAYVCDPTVTSLTNATGEIVARSVLNTPMTCVWTITLPVGMMVKMTFTEFNLDACCACAFLRIIDAEFTAIAVTGSDICGTTIPSIIPATISNQIQITLRTNGVATLPGLVIQYEGLPQPTKTNCGNGISLTEPSGIIRPSLPPYPVSITCTWNVQVASGSRIGFFFIWMSTEAGYDFITVKDMATNTVLGGGPFSGLQHVPIFESSAHRAEVKFNSDNVYPADGFYLYYYTI